MMKPLLPPAATVLAIVAIVLPSTAAAHWEYSQWLMTPDQVVAASSGKAVAQPRNYGDDIGLQQFLVRGEHKAGGRAYDIQFYFKKGGTLTLVRTLLKDKTQCDALKAELVKRHGPRSPSGQYFWIDQKAGNSVQFDDGRQFGDTCYIHYAPLG